METTQDAVVNAADDASLTQLNIFAYLQRVTSFRSVGIRNILIPSFALFALENQEERSQKNQKQKKLSSTGSTAPAK
ncbi:CLUMA_CG005993, isoform A [Clunio marinus]|uniref:CLUMA_CG005993, isoform A n=1 Tax=Clunio marinus TaxID=568069 RepID=A0A1J1HWR2_9DIPT|nr:CLUMA_CG005993, isoform A [Clunio marinus]